MFPILVSCRIPHLSAIFVVCLVKLLLLYYYTVASLRKTILPSPREITSKTWFSLKARTVSLWHGQKYLVIKKLLRFRVGVEAGISILKRAFGLDRCNLVLHMEIDRFGNLHGVPPIDGVVRALCPHLSIHRDADRRGHYRLRKHLHQTVLVIV